MQVVIPYKPHQYQIDFHNDKSRFRIVAGGRRVGKTKCCIQEALIHCISTQNALCWWVAPTYKEAKEIGWDELQTFIDIIRPAVKFVHHTQLKITFTNGSEMYFKGGDNPDALRGRGLSMLVGDEAAFLKDNIWGTVLRPALSDRKGRAILISTPNGFNWFSKLFKEDNSWKAYHWITSMNPLIGEEEMEDVKKEISDVDYRQEYLAEFITRAGRVYSDFNELNILTDHIVPSDEKWEIYMGMDFGFANPTAIVFMAYDSLTCNKVVQFDELYVERTQLEDIITMIYDKLVLHGLKVDGVKALYTDPAGNAGGDISQHRGRQAYLSGPQAQILQGL